MKTKTLLLILTIVLTISCGRTYREEDLTQTTLTQQDSLKQRQAQIKENLEKTNQIIIEKELERIQSFVERNSWKVKETDGVFIQHLDNGNNKPLKEGDKVKLKYRCQLLNGTKISDNSTDGDIHIKIGTQSDCPLGLQIAVSHLNQQSKARIIIPSSLAYGLSGDGNKIPRSATLVYEIEVEKIN